ncbi:MAG TPA: class IV adenylate cyclase [Candidatus Paceibacterota bacterium]
MTVGPQEEIEVKFLEIDVDGIQRKLKDLGATKIGQYFYRRRVFDYPDYRLNNAHAWLRLRDEGERVTLTFKQRLGATSHDGTVNDTSMREIEVVVSDFDKTAELILALGFIEKFYQENRRIRWEKDGIEFDIDSQPEIKPYMEIEAKSWEDIDKAIWMLGLNPEDKKIFSTQQVYKLYGIDENDYKRMAFDGMVKK